MIETATEHAFAPARGWDTNPDGAAPGSGRRGAPVLASIQRPDDSWIWAGAAFGAAFAYATLRYNVFRGVPWADWSSYTLNKALGFGSLILIATVVFRLRRPGRRTGVLMASAGALGLAHSLLSFALLNPVYYAAFFDGGKLTFLAGVSLAVGAAATAAMDVGARRSASWTPGQRHAGLALVALAVGVHAALPGVSRWIAPLTWPGWMPPITLLSFLCGVAAVIAWRCPPANGPAPGED